MNNDLKPTLTKGVCPRCKGEKLINAPDPEDIGPWAPDRIKCPDCKGTGKLSPQGGDSHLDNPDPDMVGSAGSYFPLSQKEKEKLESEEQSRLEEIARGMKFPASSQADVTLTVIYAKAYADCIENSRDEVTPLEQQAHDAGLQAVAAHVRSRDAERIRVLEEAARAFLERVDLIEECQSYKAVWESYVIHGHKERDALRAALAEKKEVKS